jgi:peroxiredoxin
MTTSSSETRDNRVALQLIGRQLPDLTLSSTSGEDVRIQEFSTGRWILFVYPRTGVPGEAEPTGWDELPGAKGCTAEACSFRDNLAGLIQAGAEKVAGLSVQSTAYQQEAVQRLHLPYPLLSDQNHDLSEAIHLPSFEADGLTLLSRITLVIDGTMITHVFYPVHPAAEHAEQVRDWLQSNVPSERRRSD